MDAAAVPLCCVCWSSLVLLVMCCDFATQVLEIKASLHPVSEFPGGKGVARCGAVWRRVFVVLCCAVAVLCCAAERIYFTLPSRHMDQW
jgi:hypothetical protein